MYISNITYETNKRIVSYVKLLCKICGKEYNYKQGKGYSKEYCCSCSQKSRKQRHKLKAIAYLGGKCMICGYDKCVEALEFHHRDKEEKEFEISDKYNIAFSKLILELEKCDLLCANCHREVHYLYQEGLDFSIIKTQEEKAKKHSICPTCGNVHFNKVYCSEMCLAIGARKTMRPSYEQLLTDLDNMSYVKVGQKYGVSDNSIRKWLKSYQNAS